MSMTSVIICIIIFIFFIYVLNSVRVFFKGIRVQSTIDNRWYLVRDVNPEYNQKNADILALINQKISKLLHHLKKSKHNEFQINVDLLISRYDPDAIMENISQVDTTFTVDKGERLEVCTDTRNSINPQLEDMNTLIFVILHEMGHMASITYGHNTEFKKNFAFLVKKAIEIDIYKYVDYKVTPVRYCGMDIRSNVI